jgi:hypothetical protein
MRKKMVLMYIIYMYIPIDEALKLDIIVIIFSASCGWEINNAAANDRHNCLNVREYPYKYMYVCKYSIEGSHIW